jgi:hypothetical protein
MRFPLNVRTMLAGPLLARVYAALVYLASLVLVFGAAVLTGTHAREAFIFVFLPGVLLAVLSVFIWSGRRAAMILALAVAIAVELMMIGNDPRNWWQFLAVPVVFGALTVAGFSSPAGRGGEPTHRVADEVYAAVVYFAGLLAVFMAPFNHSRHFGGTGVALYALLVGAGLGSLSVLIWSGRRWAMIATFALALGHWLLLAGIDPSLWRSLAFIAAPVVSGILTVICIAAGARAKTATKTKMP